MRPLVPVSSKSGAGSPHVDPAMAPSRRSRVIRPDDDGGRGVPGLRSRDRPGSPIRLDHVHAGADLPERRRNWAADRRRPPSTTKNWLPDCPGGADRRLRHRDRPRSVRGVRRRRLGHAVAGPAVPVPGRVAALDHEARHDPVEGRVVVDPLLAPGRRRSSRSSASSTCRARSRSARSSCRPSPSAVSPLGAPSAWAASAGRAWRAAWRPARSRRAAMPPRSTRRPAARLHSAATARGLPPRASPRSGPGSAQHRRGRLTAAPVGQEQARCDGMPRTAERSSLTGRREDRPRRAGFESSAGCSIGWSYGRRGCGRRAHARCAVSSSARPRAGTSAPAPDPSITWRRWRPPCSTSSPPRACARGGNRYRRGSTAPCARVPAGKGQGRRHLGGDGPARQAQGRARSRRADRLPGGRCARTSRTRTSPST